jgi:hypothetical protein
MGKKREEMQTLPAQPASTDMLMALLVLNCCKFK